MKHLIYLPILICTCLNGTESIPEPLLFDLIRPLDAKKGELEINTLVSKSYTHQNQQLSNDPFGSGTTTQDRKQLEWSPEIEYALADGFALEFELPAEGKHIEAYKIGGQYTLGKLGENYIHGLQVLLEPNVAWKHFNTTLLYLGGYRFDEIFSTLFMLGGRMNLEGNHKSQTFEYLANGSIFAQLPHHVVLGMETNYALSKENHYALTLVPQIHYEAHRNMQFQAGLSFGNASFSKEKAFVIRGIYSF